MNIAFNGSYASRVSLLLRETKGYTYSFRSSLQYSHQFGQLIMRTSVTPDVALDSIDSIRSEMRRFLGDRPNADGVERARRFHLSRIARRFTTNAGTAAAFDDIVLYGLPLDSWTIAWRPSLPSVLTTSSARRARCSWRIGSSSRWSVPSPAWPTSSCRAASGSRSSTSIVRDRLVRSADRQGWRSAARR